MKDTDNIRSDPHDLLQRMQREDAHSKKGRLKIFFGMAAGSGKTYAMLAAAQRGLVEGKDIVAAYIESHGRSDTEKLKQGIPFIPRRKLTYKEIAFEEMDLDAVLQRKPQIVLVDELAHTNIPGSRHPKRYQDVFELLDAGIDVYTTLNVQHLESRCETVKDITGIVVQETLPDSVLDRSDEIELVDISPDELRKRLFAGKIYSAERVPTAAENFFEPGNLTALREMALRLTAEKVDHSLQDYKQEKRILEPWKTGERLIVAVSPSPYSNSLIRWTRRMAYNLGASWIAVYVETSRPLSQGDQERLQKNLSLARELGAEIVWTRDEDVTKGILRIARQRNITQIVAGKPGRRSWMDFFRFQTPIKYLIKESGNIDLYIVRASGSLPKQKTNKDYVLPTAKNRKQLLAATVTLILVVSFCYGIYPFVGARSVALILLFSVLIMALFVTRLQVLVYASLSALLWNFLFLPPQFTFYVYQIDDAIMFLMYFVIAIVAGSLTHKIRRHELSATQREEQLNVLYDVTKKFASATTIDEAARYVLAYINTICNADSILLLKSDDNVLSRTPYLLNSKQLEEKDFAVATFCFTSNKIAGRFTDTLPDSPYLFIPLAFKHDSVVGVLGIQFVASGLLSMEKKTMIETLASHLALVIERDFFTKATEKAKINAESAKIFKLILNSLSHELRTPLTTIKGSISMLKNNAIADDQRSRADLLNDSASEVERLIMMVDNLLDMNRIESGKLTLNKDWNDITDIIDTTLNRLESMQKNHAIQVVCPTDIPLIYVDYNLISLALYSVLHNALVHTEPETKITIEVINENNGIILTVADDGPGLPADTNKIFEKFYRHNKKELSGGLGLGLSIAKGIVDLHGGKIIAENKTPVGARFILHFPGAFRNE